jgi:hypothetical protein
MARPPPHVPDDALLIRRIHEHDLQQIEPSITPLCKSHPTRGELELRTYGRKHLEQFDSKLSGRKTWLSTSPFSVTRWPATIPGTLSLRRGYIISAASRGILWRRRESAGGLHPEPQEAEGRPSMPA